MVADKENLVKGILPGNEKLIILDEIHKYTHWRNLVKGLYDKYHSHTNFIITGSARLDYYSRGGDSLHGRYHYYRLHPFSLNEIDSDCNRDALLDLQVSHETVQRWMRIVENMYIGYFVAPYSSKGTEKIRVVKKEKKFYLWDWSVCVDIGEKPLLILR